MEAHNALSIAASKASFGGTSEEDLTAKDFAIAIATHIGREHMLTSSRISRQVSPLGSTRLYPVSHLQVMTGQLLSEQLCPEVLCFQRLGTSTLGFSLISQRGCSRSSLALVFATLLFPSILGFLAGATPCLMSFSPRQEQLYVTAHSCQFSKALLGTRCLTQNMPTFCAN